MTRLDILAVRMALAAVRHTGLPSDADNAKALAEQSYLAARFLLDCGKHLHPAASGAQRGQR